MVSMYDTSIIGSGGTKAGFRYRSFEEEQLPKINVLQRGRQFKVMFSEH